MYSRPQLHLVALVAAASMAVLGACTTQLASTPAHPQLPANEELVQLHDTSPDLDVNPAADAVVSAPLTVAPGVPSTVATTTSTTTVAPTTTSRTPSTTVAPAPIPAVLPAEVPAAVQGAWDELVADWELDPSKLSVVVDVAAQQLWVLSTGTVESHPVSTGKGGVSDVPGSSATPAGVHKVSWVVRGERDEILRGFGPSGVISTPGGTAHMTTRAFALEGLERRNVNSLYRGIFVHGTNRDDQLGVAASGGCVRVADETAEHLDTLIDVGTLVYVVAAT